VGNLLLRVCRKKLRRQPGEELLDAWTKNKKGIKEKRGRKRKEGKKKHYKPAHVLETTLRLI